MLEKFSLDAVAAVVEGHVRRIAAQREARNGGGDASVLTIDQSPDPSTSRRTPSRLRV
jgi:hypothetical protein